MLPIGSVEWSQPDPKQWKQAYQSPIAAETMRIHEPDA
jgi:hypothetical protein